MEYAKRSSYLVIKAFESPIYLPLSKSPVFFPKGKIITLREDGKVAKDWLLQGLIVKEEAEPIPEEAASVPNGYGVFYHCTTSSYQDSILSKGLLQSRSVSELHGKKPIYLSNTPRHGFGNTCFRVCIPLDWVEQTVNLWEFICNRDIPREHVTYHSYEEDE